MVNKLLLTILAIVASIGLVGITVTETISMPQQQQVTEAKSPVGECASFLKNASAQICHNLI